MHPHACSHVHGVCMALSCVWHGCVACVRVCRYEADVWASDARLPSHRRVHLAEFFDEDEVKADGLDNPDE